MILLDTNVVSELMRTVPARPLLDWFAKHEAADLFISAVTEAELRTGVAILLTANAVTGCNWPSTR